MDERNGWNYGRLQDCAHSFINTYVKFWIPPISFSVCYKCNIVKFADIVNVISFHIFNQQMHTTVI